MPANPLSRNTLIGKSKLAMRQPDGGSKSETSSAPSTVHFSQQVELGDRSTWHEQGASDCAKSNGTLALRIQDIRGFSNKESISTDDLLQRILEPRTASTIVCLIQDCTKMGRKRSTHGVQGRLKQHTSIHTVKHVLGRSMMQCVYSSRLSLPVKNHCHESHKIHPQHAT